MAVDALKNFAYGTLSNSPGTAGTSFVLQTGQGANFPTGTFSCTCWPVNQLPLSSNSEIVRGTVSGDTLTVTRQQEGTGAINVVAGYQIAQTITAGLLAEIIASIVTSFNTRSGAVTLTKADVTGTGLTYTDVGADQSGIAASLVGTETTRAEAAEALLAPKAAPTFTGLVTIPTRSPGDSTTAAASTAFVTAAVAAAVGVGGATASAWPVGSVFLAYSATNPATLLGFTSTWVQIAQGQMLVGQLNADPNFGTLGNTGGALTVTLSTNQIPAHTHTFTTGLSPANNHTHGGTTGYQVTGLTDSGHQHTEFFGGPGGGSSWLAPANQPTSNSSAGVGQAGTTGIGAAQLVEPSSGGNTGHAHAFSTGYESAEHTHSGTTAANTTTGASVSILNPYLVVYIWRRTA